MDQTGEEADGNHQNDLEELFEHKHVSLSAVVVDTCQESPSCVVLVVEDVSAKECQDPTPPCWSSSLDPCPSIHELKWNQEAAKHPPNFRLRADLDDGQVLVLVVEEGHCLHGLENRC